jgi:predicted transposase
MKLTAKIKLTPDEWQYQSLLKTLEVANAACNAISEVAWDKKVFKKYSLQQLCYYAMRQQFELTAQVVILLLGKVADAYKKDKRIKRAFRPHGSIAYDSRILSFKLSQQTVSIWTVDGRKTVPFVAGDRQVALLQHQRGENDLVLL